MRVVVIGASSLVGQALLATLPVSGDDELFLLSRQLPPSEALPGRWLQVPRVADLQAHQAMLHDAIWVCLAPIWVLIDYLPEIERCAPRQVIALSSTSRYSKLDSAASVERRLAQRLADAEAAFEAWAHAQAVPWVILQPTLIHGFGRDANVAAIARFIARFGFFPLLGQGSGLRRPVHARDVAQAVLQAMERPKASCAAYVVSGGEVLSYRAMVCRVFAAMGRHPRLLTVPRWALRLALGLLHGLGLARHLTIGMADRMEQDLDFPHTLASERLGFQPGPFVPDVVHHDAATPQNIRKRVSHPGEKP